MMKKMKILLVEDDQLERDRIANYLSLLDYEVVPVANYQEAMDTLNPSFGLLVLDIHLGAGGNGIDIAIAARQHPHIAIVFLSDHKAIYQARLSELGYVAGFVPKSFTRLTTPPNLEPLKDAIDLALHNLGREEIKHAQKGCPFVYFYQNSNTNAHVQYSYDDMIMVSSSNKVLEIYVIDSFSSAGYKKVTITGSKCDLGNFLAAANKFYPRHNLIRVHNSYAVNTEHIAHVNHKNYEIVMKSFSNTSLVPSTNKALVAKISGTDGSPYKKQLDELLHFYNPNQKP